MVKNGLFIMSIGFLLFVYSANAATGEYNWINLLSAVFLIAIGFFVYRRGAKKEKENKKVEDNDNGNQKKS
ncbi:cbb3-type cytochrome oxidase subunit 3 [Enterococcus sp. PF1-24]|uniref:hypothetical protein n=1 Tax=unclassified Enterococcus TaxID=2608891 RepID=UPI00247410DB|nr:MULTISPECIES: hypothetical protein [unclassified Enterococcus]MDH6364465.1 cbb3-type cytochrome oxidase subunit 3 [Enterococcus sp. PFB1-1]MDH6401512.1 cbb3-type cytochrome oxidase subunit 3 [Enterococcus sp. PF1-24]